MSNGVLIGVNGVYKVYYWPGRQQPYTLWKEGYVTKFMEHVGQARHYVMIDEAERARAEQSSG
jgi:hypothetical protein